MPLTPITKTITSLTLFASLLLSACGQNRQTQTTSVQDSSQETKTTSVQNSQQENEVNLPIYRIDIKICEGSPSIDKESDDCDHKKFFVWGADNTKIINNNFEPQVVLLANGPFTAKHFGTSHTYKVAIQSYGCWPENKPSPKGLYLSNKDLIFLEDDFHDRRKQISLTPDQFEVQLLTNFDEMVSEQVDYDLTKFSPLVTQSCKKINLPSNS